MSFSSRGEPQRAGRPARGSMHILSWAGGLWMLLWAAATFPLLIHLIFSRPLGAEGGEDLDEDRWPAVTIVVPVRNEESGLQRSIPSLLALDYPRLHIVALEDRCTDRSSRLLDCFSRGEPRLQVLHIGELPKGWLGKNHANWLGAAQRDDPWILFTDADVEFSPGALKFAMAKALRCKLDHLALFPRLLCSNWWECLLSHTFGLLFSIRFQPWLAATRIKRFYIGIGAFNLIRRQAYQRIGTHRALALEVADDLQLGRRVKQAGLRQQADDGRLLLQIRWQEGPWGVIRGLTKNAFASYNYSVLLVLWETLVFAAAVIAPYILSVAAPLPFSAGFLLCLLILHLTFALLLWRSERQPLLTLLLPFSLLLIQYAVWRSMLVTLRQGGVYWRDSFYPLRQLKRRDRHPEP